MVNPVTKERQDAVNRVKKLLAKDPARMNRLRVEWDRTAELLAPYFIAKRLKSYEVHMLLDRARFEIIAQIEAGTPDRLLWVYAMHAIKRPAAIYPPSSSKRKTKP